MYCYINSLVQRNSEYKIRTQHYCGTDEIDPVYIPLELSAHTHVGTKCTNKKIAHAAIMFNSLH